MQLQIAVPSKHRIYVASAPFSSANDTSIADTIDVSRLGSRTRLDRHESLFYAGDSANRVFEVEQGAVMVFILLADGRRQVVEIVLPGGICGFSSGVNYTSSCEALSPVTLRAYRRGDLKRHDALRTYMFEKAEHQLCLMHEHSLSLGRKTAEERVSSLLARFAEHGVISSADRSIAVDLPLTRGEIGDYLGLSLETVCRILTGLQNQGVIRIGRRHGEILIHNLRNLRRLAALEIAA